MKKRALCLMSLLLALVFGLTVFAGCGQTSDPGGDPPPGTGTQPENPPEENDDKVLSDALFADPSLDDRPMVMMHSVGNTLIDDVFSRGYGGIVTNVAWNTDYLQNTRSWSSMASSVEYAIGKGMHVWLYDEYGYPSGTAYGQTLEGNPEYEALGLVPQYAVVAPGDTGRIDLLHGHTAIVGAYVYDGTSQQSMDLSGGISVASQIASDGSSVSYTNRTSSSKVLVAFMSKPWYEFTHSMENWYAQQRYINMLLDEPVQKFISLTHEQYKDWVGQWFGKGIQAFFTDEPALQGSYFTISDRPRQVLDQPDLNIPIVECLNYSASLLDDFEATYGYELEPYLGYLYNDDGSAIAKQVRMDFYALTGELFRTNYLGQIENWCAENGVASSGHLLLEETLYQNPWFAGNMIQLLGTMGIPGTDLLYSEPLGAADAACIVSKMASSAADFTGKGDTFAEISGAFDGTAGDIYDQINAVGVQVCMGINTFASYYYQGGDHTQEEDELFSAALGRMRYMTTGADHRAKVAVYYPYEGVSAETLPSVNMYQPTDAAKQISDSFADLCRTLVGKQIDYDLVDWMNLSACKVEDGALVAPNGEAFTAVVLPYTTALRSESVLKLIEAAEAGVEIVLLDFDEVVCERGANATAARFAEVAEAAHIVTSSNAAANYLRENGHTYATLDNANAVNVFLSKRENANYSVFTAVNAYSTERTYTFTLEAEGSSVRWYDVLSGTVREVEAQAADGKLTFTFTLPANATGFFVAEKS